MYIKKLNMKSEFNYNYMWLTIAFPQMALLYFVAQILGGLAGSGLLLYITPSDVYALGGQNGFCSTVPNPTVSIAQALTVEYVATMVLVTISCTAWDPRNAKLQDSIALKLGLTVSALSIAFVS